MRKFSGLVLLLVVPSFFMGCDSSSSSIHGEESVSPCGIGLECQESSSNFVTSVSSEANSSGGVSSVSNTSRSSSSSFDGASEKMSSEATSVNSSAVETSSAEALSSVSGESSDGKSSAAASSSSSSQVVPQSSSQPPEFSAGPLLSFDFYTGADISTVQEYERNNTKFYDVDGSESDIFTILKKHGFNAIRLRTFVSPLANYGYAAKSSECGHSGDEAYGDKEHIIAYAKKVKAAGMAFLLDIHYSDNWADPGKQIIPERWRNVSNSDAMADSVYAYTKDLMTSLKNAGATPEMVQIGNETTPGILIHVPSGSTDCWGNNPAKASTAINGDMGTTAGKENAAKYFKAGAKAVKDVSPDTKTSFHIERIRKPETVTWWMGVIFDEKKISVDAMGFSAYTAYGDGAPSAWKNLFNTLGSKYPKLQFFIAEYNGGDSKNHYNFDGSRKQTNEMVRGMDRWIGTFFWEPTLGGEWGPALFDWSGNSLKANAKAFEEFK